VTPDSWTGQRRLLGITAAVALLGATVYLVAAAATLRLGFPLDDAWIHQTYARNLASAGEWAFVPGEASGGSTSPLWTVLLAVGRAANVDPRGWAYLLGITALVLTGYFVARWLRARGWGSGAALALALLTVAEWHLLWASVSGMEIMLVVLLIAVVLWAIERPGWRPEMVGALIGVGVWIRPDVITLVMIPGGALLLEPGRDLRARAIRLLRLAGGLIVPLGLYLLFNLRTAGTIWPSTFYAKQEEYASLTETPFFARLARVGLQPLVGPGVLLLPGAFLAAAWAARSGRWVGVVTLTWALAYLALYAARLPVTYQHGRYEMPVLPVLLLLGGEGLLLARKARSSPARRLAVRAWAASILAVTLAFLFLGAGAYGRDVAFIESEMVDSAVWIRDHTDPGAVIAAHDIGALGYFGEREVVDLAGLTDAEVIPVIRQEAGLAAVLWQEGADYLMTFPSWYPALVSCGELRHASGGAFSPAQGGENMAVYAWPSSPDLAPRGCMLYSPESAANAFVYERHLDSDRR
jgi:hypothetical protein